MADDKTSCLILAILFEKFLGRYGADLEDKDWNLLCAALKMFEHRSPAGWVNPVASRGTNELSEQSRIADAWIIVYMLRGYARANELTEKMQKNVRVLVKAVRRYT